MATYRSCAICMIQSTSPPTPNPTISAGPTASSYMLLSTSSVIAFLDIAPLSRGHVILAPRSHHAKLSDVPPSLAAVLGFWLQVVSRGVLSGLLGDRWEARDEGWDVVSANGAAGGQTIGHAHFHVIPRPGPEVPALFDRARDPSVVLDYGRRREDVLAGARNKLADEDVLGTCELVKRGVRREVRRLRAEGTIVEGGDGEWDLWLAVDGKKGLRL